MKVHCFFLLLMVFATVMAQRPGPPTAGARPPTEDPRPPPRPTPRPTRPPGPPSPPPQCRPPVNDGFRPPIATTCPHKIPSTRIKRHLDRNKKLKEKVNKERSIVSPKQRKLGFCRRWKPRRLGPTRPPIGSGRCRSRRLYYKFPDCVMYQGQKCYVLRPWRISECPYIRCGQRECSFIGPRTPPGRRPLCIHTGHRTVVYYIVCLRPFKFVERFLRFPQGCPCRSLICRP